MNSGLRKALSGFISQQIELGETEWYIGKTSVDTFKKLIDSDYSAESPVNKASFDNTPVISVKHKDNKKNIHNIKPEDTSMSESEEKICNPETANLDAIGKSQSLDELDGNVCGCLRCRLGFTRTNFVFGTGNLNADIMFVGEAPGADEDLQGKPFVGRAGQLLTKMIEAINFKREDVYIGNVLKCRPPGNRDPKPDEVEACEPILLRQLEIIKPKIICALGRISGQTLLRTQGTLGSLRGKFHDYHGIKLLVTYHPAALLRNPNWKPEAWEDLKLLRREYDNMEL